MIWRDHFELRDKHAFLSPSNYHWIRYDEEKMSIVYNKHLATLRGTELHDLASKCIALGVRLPNSKKNILNLYVNDAIGYRMRPEQPLYYSENCFGTADTISFKSNLLRIHDLKTGTTPASMDQLCVYASLFCLEYGKDPNDIDIELRLYQAPEPLIKIPEKDYIRMIIDKIILFDKQIESIKGE